MNQLVPISFIGNVIVVLSKEREILPRVGISCKGVSRIQQVRNNHRFCWFSLEVSNLFVILLISRSDVKVFIEGFRAADEDGSNSLDANELFDTLAIMGEHHSMEEIQ